MTTLEERFAALMADATDQKWHFAPSLVQNGNISVTQRTRTVYSVGEAISQRGRDAKLGAGAIGDTSTRR